MSPEHPMNLVEEALKRIGSVSTAFPSVAWLSPHVGLRYGHRIAEVESGWILVEANNGWVWVHGSLLSFT